MPTPRSAPLVRPDALWPARRIAEALVAGGFGASVVPYLERLTVVPKPTYAKPGERPNARRHYDTIGASGLLLGSGRITVDDDFVTKGNTLLAEACRVKGLNPTADGAAFALVRTKGLVPEVEYIVEPCVDTLRLHGNEADRQP